MPDKRVFSTVSEVEYRSTLGTAFRVGGDSAAEYLLHPTFLQFAILCLAVLAVLDQGGGMGPSLGWQGLLIWLAVGVVALLGGFALMGMLAMLPQRVTGKRRFTPLILMPLVALAEISRAGMLVALDLGAWPQLDELTTNFARSMIVVLILDVMHALYVVPVHPLARAETAEPRVEPEARPDVEVAEAEAAEPLPLRPTVAEITIADRRYEIDEILWIRTEDHYLNVVSTKGRSLLRAKLSDLQALQDGKIGMQVNRSQWVAFAAISEVVEETGGQITLRLATGDDAAVARSRRIMFRQMITAWRQRQDG